MCAFTTDPTEAPLFRLRIDPDEVNGLREPCSLMVDKITTVPRSKLGERIGRLSDEEMIRLGRGTLSSSDSRADPAIRDTRSGAIGSAFGMLTAGLEALSAHSLSGFG